MTRRAALVLVVVVCLLGCAPGPQLPAPPSGAGVSTVAPSPDPAAPGDLLAGRTNPAVTPDTIRATICTHGYTAKVRPPFRVTEAAKRQLIAAEHPGTPTRAWVLDHLVPLEGGGAPGSATDLRNFALQSRADSLVKDRLERTMNRDICSGLVPLRTAQAAMAADWRAYKAEVGDP